MFPSILLEKDSICNSFKRVNILLCEKSELKKKSQNLLSINIFWHNIHYPNNNKMYLNNYEKIKGKI